MNHKRIVLLHQTGPLAGVYQIHGTTDEVPMLPSLIEGVTFLDGHIGQAALADVHDRYVLYREVVQ